ncbi:MAG: bacillithiol biosynthesis cysteine-adding enzyme BshC [Ignavibacteria bacterium]|nr:bacillithiol biosynthesis cysteine-adding enzyme BshC [Ignavibacteria bacterium]
MSSLHSYAATVDFMEWIDYRQLPLSIGGFSELFFDFLYDYNQVQRFYKHNFRDFESYESVMRAIDERPPDRETLTRVLIGQNESFRSPAKTFENILLLEKPTTYAVVTGQQVGLFGGPMYTVFKMITTIKLAEKLKTKFPAYDFVPVFWVEGEDHDFVEMNNVSLLDSDSRVVKIEYLPGGAMPERNLGPIGELAFDASLEQTFAALGGALQKSEFTGELIMKLRECYATGRTFNQAFTLWMNFLFEDYGPIFISSNNRELKRLLSPMFVKEISEFPKTSQMVIAQSAELEEQYHAQIKAKSVNLFLFHKGGRYLIEPREHDFSLKGTRHYLQKDELLRIAQETPEMLSSNVVLRPIAQDTLLPTVAYVAGPAEVAYNAQLKPVYEYLNIPQPVLYPRASGSFVEERLERALEKYQLDLLQFFEDPEAVSTQVIERISEVKLDQVFGNTGTMVHDALNELKFGLKEIDPTLLGSLESVKSKIDTNLNVLKEKAIAAQKRRNETALRQVEKAVNTLLPNGNLQEREINVIYYMNKYGLELVNWLCGEMDITGFKHQVITL